MGNCAASKEQKVYMERGHLKEGDAVPNVIIKSRVRVRPGDAVDCFEIRDIEIKDLFKGKRVVVFSIPGAFTPICSCDHLPGYEANYEKILALGIDDIYCISVNDPFVMRQWGIMQGMQEELKDDMCPLNPGNFKKVKLIPDGAAKFTKAMGMNCKFENFGAMGERSWRYSAVFNDMKIEKLFLEEEGDMQDSGSVNVLRVSDGNTMLEYLRSTAKK